MASILEIDPEQAGLAQMASIIGQASAPSRLPVGLGSILGQAAGGYQQAKNQAMQAQAQLDARNLAISESQRQQQAKVKFNSILGKSEDPADPVSILNAGIQSGAFGPSETTQFLGQVMERRAKREQDMTIAREKLADAKISREEKESLARDLQSRLFTHQKEMADLVKTLRPVKNQQLTLDENGFRVIVNDDGTTKYLTGPDGKPMKAPPSGGNRPPPGEVMRMTIALNAMGRAIDNYENLLKDFNPRSFNQMNPTQRAKLESAVSALQLEWKEAAALGALTGPDLEIMEKTLVNPASIKGAFYGRGGLKEQIEQARGYRDRRMKSIEQYYPSLEGAGGKKDPWE